MLRAFDFHGIIVVSLPDFYRDTAYQCGTFLTFTDKNPKSKI
jgi:hypothetical protein